MSHFSCSVYALFMSSEPPMDQNLRGKRFLIFRQFGKFWSLNSDLSVGQAVTNCETFWCAKSMFSQRHFMPVPFFDQAEQSFQLDPPEKQ